LLSQAGPEYGYTLAPGSAPRYPQGGLGDLDVAVTRFNFPVFKPNKDAWPVYAAALNLAFARHKIVTSEQKKDALIFTFDTELRNSVAAGISPLTLDHPQVTFEFLSEYFKQRYDSRLTECQA